MTADVRRIGSVERRRAIATAREWFRDPNVLAIGIGEREQRGRRTGEVALVAIAEIVSEDLGAALVARAPIRSAATRLPVKGDTVEMFLQAAAPSIGRVSRIELEERVYGWAGSDANYVVMGGQIEVEGLGVRGDSGAVADRAGPPLRGEAGLDLSFVPNGGHS